jgi:DNA-binding transcriptional MerR regulator
MEKLYSIGELIKEYKKQQKLEHLSGLGDLSEATIRYYQQKGLFKPAGSSGKEARYSEDTLWRIIFIRIVQLQSAQVSGTKLTLEDIARVMNSGDMSDVIRRVALGKEKLTTAVLPTAEAHHGDWTSFAVHPDVRLEVKRKLSRAQRKQLKKIAELVESIIEGS